MRKGRVEEQARSARPLLSSEQRTRCGGRGGLGFLRALRQGCTRKTLGCRYQPASAERNKDHHLPRFIFFFPGRSPEPSSGSAPRCGALQESRKSLASIPLLPPSPGEPRSSIQPVATLLFLTWTPAPEHPFPASPHLPTPSRGCAEPQ